MSSAAAYTGTPDLLNYTRWMYNQESESALNHVFGVGPQGHRVNGTLVWAAIILTDGMPPAPGFTSVIAKLDPGVNTVGIYGDVYEPVVTGGIAITPTSNPITAVQLQTQMTSLEGILQDGPNGGIYVFLGRGYISQIELDSPPQSID